MPNNHEEQQRFSQRSLLITTIAFVVSLPLATAAGLTVGTQTGATLGAELGIALGVAAGGAVFVLTSLVAATMLQKLIR